MTEDGVKIVKLDKGVSVWFWLCAKHLAAKLAKGWSHMETRAMPVKQECDECRIEQGKFRT